MAQLVERPPSTQDVAGWNPARGSSFFLLRKKELSSGVVVYFALSLRMSLHVMYSFTILAQGLLVFQILKVVIVEGSVVYTCCGFVFFCRMFAFLSLLSSLFFFLFVPLCM